MKLRNKKTGESYETTMPIVFNIKTSGGGEHTVSCESITELNEKWEDVPEEPKGSALDLMILTLTDFIENEPDEYKVDLEDCKQMLDKLKAWKRLKDNGFKFDGYSHYDWNGDESPAIAFEYSDFDRMFDDKQVVADLDLLFGGEE